MTGQIQAPVGIVPQCCSQRTVLTVRFRSRRRNRKWPLRGNNFRFRRVHGFTSCRTTVYRTTIFITQQRSRSTPRRCAIRREWQGFCRSQSSCPRYCSRPTYLWGPPCAQASG